MPLGPRLGGLESVVPASGTRRKFLPIASLADVNVRFRRYCAIQPRPGGRVLMPLCRHWLTATGSSLSGGKLPFAQPIRGGPLEP
jgi:hypothetical protein